MNHYLLLQIDPNNSAQQSGYFAGQLLFSVLALAGALKCISIAKRPEANRKCVHSLAVFLFAMSLGGVIQFLVRTLPAQQRVFFGIFGFVVFVAMLTAIILAILGLVEYSKRKPDYTQGRAQAIWCLVLSTLFLSIMISGFMKGREQARALATNQPRTGETLSFKDLNYNFKAPSRPWVKLDVSKINKVASLGFMRASPQIYFMVIAENAGIALDLDSNHLVELCKGNLQSLSTDARFTKEVPRVLNALNGIQLDSDVRLQNLELSYVHWACATNGYAFQLVCWGNRRDKAAVHAAAEEMFLRFGVNDLSQVSAPFVRGTADFQSKDFHYRVRLQNSPWQMWPSLEQKMPQAEFGALSSRPFDSAMVVVPVNLEQFQPNQEALSKSFLALFNVSFSDEKLSAAKLINQQGVDGVDYEFERELDGANYSYRFRILRQKEAAYLLAAWTSASADKLDEFFAESFSRVEFDSSSGPFPSPENFTTLGKERQAFLLNQIGLYYFNARQFEKSISFFETASRLNPKAVIYFKNTLAAQSSLGNYATALAYLEKAPASVLQRDEIQAERARLQMQEGQSEKALETFSRLFAKDFRDEEYFLDYLSLLDQAKQTETALGVIKTHLQRKDSPVVRLWQANFLRQKKEFAEAIRILKTQREKFPNNFSTGHALIEAYLDADQEEDARALALKMIEDEDESYYVFYLKGRAEFKLKQYRDAKGSFEMALKKSPNSREIKDFLDLASGLLGEGDNSGVKEPISPVAVPESFLKYSATIPPDLEGYGACHLKHVTAISFTPKKEFKTTEYYFVKILDASGLSPFSTFRFLFDPLSEEIFVNEVVLKDASGKIISTGKVSDSYVLDENSATLTSQNKILHVPIPGLAPGCIIQIVMTRRDVAPSEKFRFVRHSFSRSFPVLENTLFVSADKSLIKFKSSPHIEPREIEGGIYWNQQRPTLDRWEPLRRSLIDFLPAVEISSISNSWAAEAKQYLESIRDRMETGEDQKILAQKIVGNATNESAKVAAIASYVQTNYTYRGLEFGRRARIPQKVPDIVQNKYGDCKDHALLLQQLLVAADVPARLALVNFNEPIEKGIPSLDQFNHMIVFLPSYKNGSFIDCTSKGDDLSLGNPLGLEERDALVLDENNPRFVSLPSQKPDASKLISQRDLEIVNRTDARVRENLSFFGPQAAYMRTFLRLYPAAMRKAAIVERLNNRNLEMDKWEIENLEDNSLPLVFRSSYLLKKQFQTVNGQILGKMPAIWERFYLTVDPAENRTTPFEVTSPITFESDVNLFLPKDWELSNAEVWKQDFRRAFIFCRTQAQTREGQLSIHSRFMQIGGSFGAKQYGRFREELNRTITDLEQNLVLVTKGTSASIK